MRFSFAFMGSGYGIICFACSIPSLNMFIQSIIAIINPICFLPVMNIIQRRCVVSYTIIRRVINTRVSNYFSAEISTRAVLSQGEPRDAAVNFDRYRILQRHRDR